MQNTPRYSPLTFPSALSLNIPLPPPTSLPNVLPLGDIAQQLRLQYKLPLLILLAALKRLIILPPHRLIALSARDIPHDVSARRHIPLGGFACGYVDDVVEQVGFAVLAAEVLAASSAQATLSRTL
jgi:hypothetical protein